MASLDSKLVLNIQDFMHKICGPQIKPRMTLCMASPLPSLCPPCLLLTLEWLEIFQREFLFGSPNQSCYDFESNKILFLFIIKVELPYFHWKIEQVKPNSKSFKFTFIDGVSRFGSMSITCVKVNKSQRWTWIRIPIHPHSNLNLPISKGHCLWIIALYSSSIITAVLAEYLAGWCKIQNRARKQNICSRPVNR